MDALIKALGQLPKWFTTLLLAMTIALMGILTYSVGRTVLWECGTITLFETTKIGNHCQHITTSAWRYLPWDGGDGAPATPQQPAPHLRICRDRAVDAAERLKDVIDFGVAVMPQGAVLGAVDQSSASAGMAKTLIVWHKVRHENTIYDVLTHCHPDAALITVSGPTDAKDRVQTVADQSREAFLNRPGTESDLPKGIDQD